MPLRFEALLALRLLREGRVQTWLILSGIAVGVAVIVFVTALIAGLQASIIERTLGTQAHIKIVPPEERALRALAAGEAEAIAIEQRAQRLRSIGNWPALLAALRQDRDILAAAPIVSGPALARRGAASRAVALLGIEPESYLRIVPTHERLLAGRFDLSGDQVLIGSLLAADLGAKPGERLRLETSGERARTVTVAGIFELGVRDLDQRLVYLGLKPAQSLLDLPAGITGIDLKVQEIFAAERIARRLQAALGVQAESWMQTNRNLLDALAAQSSSTRLISFFVAISAAFGIASVLAVSVVQKTREIGILRAVGVSRAQVRRVFLLMGAMVGLLGSLLGSALAGALIALWQGAGMNRSARGAFELYVSPELFLAAILLATLVGMLAAAFPARRAARLDPVEALRA